MDDTACIHTELPPLLSFTFPLSLRISRIRGRKQMLFCPVYWSVIIIHASQRKIQNKAGRTLLNSNQKQPHHAVILRSWDCFFLLFTCCRTVSCGCTAFSCFIGSGGSCDQIVHAVLHIIHHIFQYPAAFTCFAGSGRGRSAFV